MDFKQQLFQNGYVIIPNLVNSSENGSFIDEVLIYLNSIPRLNDRRINITKEELTNDLLKSRVKELRTNWMLHSSFGAPTELNSFQFNSVNQLREREDIYDIYKNILDEEKLLYYQDRVGIKLPGSGETEFIHIDADPWFRKEDKDAKIQSIIFFSDSKFYCIPGSHTKEYHKLITDNYDYIKKGSKPRKMTMIDKKRDILNLESKVEAIDIPKNSLLIFTENLWHASKPNKSKKIRLVSYFGYHRLNECPNTLEDRLSSYYSGRKPKSFPSGAPTYLVPKMYYNFPNSPHLMKKYLSIIPNEFWGKHTIKKSGIEVDWIDEEKWDPISIMNYIPFNHSELGKKLLGLSTWD